MELSKKIKGKILTVAVSGKIDTTTAPELEQALQEACKDIEEMILDFAEVPYISSAGLRVVLRLHKALKDKKGLRVVAVNEMVMATFAMTGFDSLICLEK